MCRINMQPTARQLALAFRSRGGKRPGAGRKPAPGRPRVSHCVRPRHAPNYPVHVTLRASHDVPSLRHRALFITIRTALASASRNGFRLLHFSVQSDHLHLLVEADEPTRFTRGVQGLAIRVAKAVNRALGRRGRVWGDRYHSRLLRTPREVRNALVYVLNNVRKHVRRVRGLDPCSSARWFTGWTTIPPLVETSPPVADARTWLARVGWRRHGRIDVTEAPRIGTTTRRR